MYLKGVGPARAAQLEAKGLKTLEDLLAYPPFRYEDRRNLKSIRQLAPGEMATVICEVAATKQVAFRRRDLGLFEMRLRDGSGTPLLAKWFHGAYLANVFAEGMRVALYGKVELDSYTGDLLMMHPEHELMSDTEDDEPGAALHLGRIVPIYEAAGRVTSRQFRVLMHRAVEKIPELMPALTDPLPEHVRARLDLPSRSEAIARLHFPAPEDDVRLLNAFRSPAQTRMIFEEFFWLECGLVLKKSRARMETGVAFDLNERVREKIKAMLPFKPTAAQRRVLAEIARDMAQPHPMNRLLQGDVGSGKTLVAAEAAVIAVENGRQTAVLAPTEILAAQHQIYLKKLFGKLGYVVAQLTGGMSAREKQQIKRLLAEGLIQVVVGTHALLEDDVEFKSLGLVIIDEQHRFGVMQRLGLRRKAESPDVLVMTATPIPRTLALTMYGDLETSVIDEMPPGRMPVITDHVNETRIEQVYSFVRQQVDEGRQAYVVYPVVEESETAAVKAAQKMHEHLSSIVYPDLRVGLLHGRLPASEKEAAMDLFKRGETQILVATTVIEVGVDVPNATVMVIEQAERFGLAQLHQLRGRVGRGRGQSYCLLVTGRLNETGRERIRTMVESTDGFYIAEMDLKLRGPGEFFGTRQSGLPQLRFANIVRDKELLETAREEARDFIENPPAPEMVRDAVAYIQNHWQRRYGLSQVG